MVDSPFQLVQDFFQQQSTVVRTQTLETLEFQMDV